MLSPMAPHRVACTLNQKISECHLGDPSRANRTGPDPLSMATLSERSLLGFSRLYFALQSQGQRHSSSYCPCVGSPPAQLRCAIDRLWHPHHRIHSCFVSSDEAPSPLSFCSPCLAPCVRFSWLFAGLRHFVANHF